ncbi:alpha/beta-Hydrolases protein [Dioscorea alata]|uniref:Alpha/beta-Hydrolases protein n=1 Tax=Dioscorea alata TaxID=55571 RepID=A0ACB7U2W1_DIOAL|nr:alpha/beta-Hydrolases protein [Dioscorea alata]
MWGDGGRVFWERRAGGAEEGVVVMFLWPSSDEKDLKPFLDLYSSVGWSSLVCQSDFLTLFFPEKAAKLASTVLDELIKEVKIKPRPITFATFSGGSKSCLYKVHQLVEGKSEGQLKDDYQLLRDCICGQIYDSGPVDFTSDLGSHFLHPKVSQASRIVSWIAKALVSGMDTLFMNRFEAQRAEYWKTLYSSVGIGPILILFSEDDELAPFQVVYDFAQHLLELGGDVRLVKWKSSPHVGHYKHHTDEYKSAVFKLLNDATMIFSQRRHQLNGETLGTRIFRNNMSDLGTVAMGSNETLRQVAVSPSDHLSLSGLMGFDDTEMLDQTHHRQKSDSPCRQNSPGSSPNGVLGQILFEACIPKNIEGWDIKPGMSLNKRQTFPSSRRYNPFNPIKCIRRSRL